MPLTFPAAERLKLLTDTYELQQTEMAQMSKRALQLQQNAAKQEMSNHKVRLVLDIPEVSCSLDMSASKDVGGAPGAAWTD